MHLSAHKGEASTELQEKALDVVHETLFDVAFGVQVRSAEEIEKVGIFEGLCHQFGVYRRQCGFEVVDSGSLSLMESGVDLNSENIARPPILHCLLDVPVPRFGVTDLVEKRAVMGPWHLCSKLLHSLVEGLVIVLDLVETQRNKGVVSGSCRVCYHINMKEHENEPVVVACGGCSNGDILCVCKRRNV